MSESLDKIEALVLAAVRAHETSASSATTWIWAAHLDCCSASMAAGTRKGGGGRSERSAGVATCSQRARSELTGTLGDAGGGGASLFKVRYDWS